MFRNVSGFIGTSAATTVATERTQVRTPHLVEHLTPFNPAYNDTIQRNAQTLLGRGYAAATTTDTATGMIYQTRRTQA